MKKIWMFALLAFALALMLPAQEACTTATIVPTAVPSVTPGALPEYDQVVMAAAMAPVVIALTELRGTTQVLGFVMAIVAACMMAITAWFYLSARALPSVSIGSFVPPDAVKKKPGITPAVRHKPAAAARGIEPAARKPKRKPSKVTGKLATAST